LDIFSPKLADWLPDYRPHNFSIDLIPNAPLPKKLKPYRQPPLLHELGRKYMADLLSKGYARESKSPIAAPLMYIPKKDSDPPFRPVVDYRCLNAIMKRWHHPLPLPDDIFAAAHSTQIFSHLDLRSTFYLIRIKPEDIWKTAFITPDGQYEYEVMPFGLTNAPRPSSI
jgi:hypothetical protein